MHRLLFNWWRRRSTSKVLQWEIHHAQDTMNSAIGIFCHILILFWWDHMLETYSISHIQEDRSTGITPQSSPSWRRIYWTRSATVVSMQFPKRWTFLPKATANISRFLISDGKFEFLLSPVRKVKPFYMSRTP